MSSVIKKINGFVFFGCLKNIHEIVNKVCNREIALDPM